MKIGSLGFKISQTCVKTEFIFSIQQPNPVSKFKFEHFFDFCR